MWKITRINQYLNYPVQSMSLFYNQSCYIFLETEWVGFYLRPVCTLFGDCFVILGAVVFPNVLEFLFSNFTLPFVGSILNQGLLSEFIIELAVIWHSLVIGIGSKQSETRN